MKKEIKMITSLFMVRHAASPFILGKEQERGLSEQGLMDARKIANLLESEKMDYFCTSTYTRAIETIRYLAEASNKEIHEYDELRERLIASVDIEIDEEQLLNGIKKSFLDKDFKMKEGESTREAQERAIPVIKQLLIEHQGKKIVLGTHGNIMTIILNYFNEGYGYEFWKITSKPDIYRMDFEELQLMSVTRLWK
jgi:2,3-bisphosphoglycerate-dependent phosphoglycerate mutase